MLLNKVVIFRTFNNIIFNKYQQLIFNLNPFYLLFSKNKITLIKNYNKKYIKLMINLRFAIPFLLLFAHQHLSNNIIGLNNPVISISFFLTFIFTIFIFLTTNKKVNNFKYFAISIAILFILLWIIKPILFKDLAFLYLNIFLTYYIVSQNGLNYIKKQLKIVIIFSAIISIIQISGISSFLHILNSQFITDTPKGLANKIEVSNILTNNIPVDFDFDSRQVRPPGIFHSSALLGGIIVLYISYIFLGVFNSLKSYAFIPFLCIYSGSKLVLSATILFLFLSILFRRINFIQLLTIFIGGIFSIFTHMYLFKYLFDFQFNYDIFFYSLDIRFFQYSIDNLDFEYISNILFKIIIFFIFLITLNNLFKFVPSVRRFYNYLILVVAISASFFATPHIANLLFGWFYFPAFFFYKEIKPDFENQH